MGEAVRWSIIIDQRTPRGNTQRYGPYEPIDDSLCGAIEEALSLSGLYLASEWRGYGRLPVCQFASRSTVAVAADLLLWHAERVAS